MADEKNGMPAHERGFGATLQARLDALTERAGARPAGAVALGALLAAGVVIGGFLAFILAWAILVGLLN